MNRVHLLPDGQLKAEDQRGIQDPLACLGHQVKLADGCTLRSIFRMLANYQVLTRLGDFYLPLVRHYDNCPQEGCLWPELAYLELTKTVEMVGYPGTPKLEIYNTFQGVGPDGASEIRSLALEFLLDMPLRLGRLKHVIFGDKVDTFDFDTGYSLFEFIDSIAWELSFHGTPAQCKI
ncbi:MAG: hypothetical protein PVH87_20860 [Desulfobacteraceae bacterium]|jgi:hypothetical protein